MECPTCLAGYQKFVDMTETTLLTCERCTDYCEQCENNICIDCETDYHLTPGNLTCVADCEVGYYKDHQIFSDYETGVCELCHENCISCTGPETTDCQECHSTFYMDVDTGCTACHSNCATCDGGMDMTDCTSCSDGFYQDNSQWDDLSSSMTTDPPRRLQEGGSVGEMYTFSCVDSQSCPALQFANNLTWMCEDCPEGCAECSTQSR